MLAYLIDLLLKLARVLVQPGDLVMQVHLHLLALLLHLLHTLVGPVKLALDLIETLG